MKRVTTSLALLIMSLVISVFATPAPANAAVINCVRKTAQSYMTLSVGGPISHKDMAISVNVGYDSCTDLLGPYFVRPKWVRATTNVAGSRMGCSNGGSILNPSTTGGHYETRFKLYFSDHTGRNFDISRFSTPCSSDTTSTRRVLISARRSVRLYVTHDDPARFRANVEVDWRGTRDPGGSMRGYLRR